MCVMLSLDEIRNKENWTGLRGRKFTNFRKTSQWDIQGEVSSRDLGGRSGDLKTQILEAFPSRW